MAGYGLAGFGGGFGQGLAAVLLQNRHDQRAEQARQDERKDREFGLLFPTMWKNAQETGDFQGLEQWVGQYHPELIKKFQKEGSPFEALAPLLRTQQRQSTISEQDAIPGMPDRIEEPARTFLGMQMQSPEGQRAQLEQDIISKGSAEYGAKTAVARRLAQQTGMSFEEALDRVGMRQSTTSAAQFRSIAGEMPDGSDAFAILDVRSGQYLDPITREPLQGFRPRATGTSTPSAGVAYNRAAQLAGFKSFNDVPADKRAEVAKKAEEIEKGLREQGAFGAGMGTGAAKQATGIDIPTSQSSGLPVGTTPNDVKGQTVPTMPQQETGRSLESLKAGMTRLDQLLDILPSEKEAFGAIPGATMAARRRMNSASGIKDENGKMLSYREATAQLDSVVSSMLNVLARVRDQQRGTQTEKDAERAMDTLVKAQTSFYDVAGGDTRESARARLKESFAALQRAIDAVPKVPAAGKPAGQSAAPATTAAPAGAAKQLPGGLWQWPDGRIMTGPPPKPQQ